MKLSAAGVLLGLLISVLAFVIVGFRVDETPRVANVWPLIVGIGAAVLTWVLQGLVMYLLARSQLRSVRLGDMIRIYLAAAFIGGISPVRGLEIPREQRLGGRGGCQAGVRLRFGLAAVPLVSGGSPGSTLPCPLPLDPLLARQAFPAVAASCSPRNVSM